MDGSQTGPIVADSAYSNSCSNSQSRTSRSSKSTHSGSHSSGSSGYGGKEKLLNSALNFSDNTLESTPDKRSKAIEISKKKLIQIEVAAPEVVQTEEPPTEHVLDTEVTKEEADDAATTSMTIDPKLDDDAENIEEVICKSQNSIKGEDGFSCVISMHDGVVMYTTQSLTETLGFPRDMWLGRSFIDFVHARDQQTFASQISSGLTLPKNDIRGMLGSAAPSPAITTVATMVCRIRRYRGLSSGYGVKERRVSYTPFLLKLSFKNVVDDERKIVYLIIQATPFLSAFKTPNELMDKAVPFVMRHAALGKLEYVDPESVPYLGFMPQDILNTDAIAFYHPEDLNYLQDVYERIVKEGGLPRSKCYRMLTQNGDYLKVETEWSSFINPWSRKLEFVTGKHHVIEGPTNPDVFEAPPEQDHLYKESEAERARSKVLRENIILILNEVLTKPAEVAKQHVSKRCEDLANFMDSLVEDHGVGDHGCDCKPDDDLKIEIQDYSYYERDSVLLGGISPHHEYNENKSITETHLSYNRLNYKALLQRYFESHEPYITKDHEKTPNEKIFAEPFLSKSNDMSPTGIDVESSLSTSYDSALSGSHSSDQQCEYRPTRLTESLLHKHNAEMEKEFEKSIRDNRRTSKRKGSNREIMLKKKEHLARCNAPYTSTPKSAYMNPPDNQNIGGHGVKRPSKQALPRAKQHCPASRERRRRHVTTASATMPTCTITTPAGTATCPPPVWPTNNLNGINAFIIGVGNPQTMCAITPTTTLSGGLPTYYPAAHYNHHLYTGNMSTTSNTDPTTQFGSAAVPYVMYGQPVYGSTFIYPTFNPIMHNTMQYQHQQQQPQRQKRQRVVAEQSTQQSDSVTPLELGCTNYEEACKTTTLPIPEQYCLTQCNAKRREMSLSTSFMGSGRHTESSEILTRMAEATMQKRPRAVFHTKSNEVVDKTDGESSYSSFYSSFFKTESGSNDDSSEAKKFSSTLKYNKRIPVKKVAKRKMEPPWLDQVCVTSNLIYKYQLNTPNVDEVLKADKERMETLEQPAMVNEQLGQLYLDLQLEGVASRLTLEEGISSSSSSGEESTSTKMCKRKREYSKLVMIYEEDAPLPPPSTTDLLSPDIASPEMVLLQPM